MEFLNEFAAVPAIGVIVYLIAEIFKVAANSRESWLKLIPVLCGVLGGVLGSARLAAYPRLYPCRKYLYCRGNRDNFRPGSYRRKSDRQAAEKDNGRFSGRTSCTNRRPQRGPGRLN